MNEEIKKLVNQYCRIDYEDDNELLELIYQVVIDEMKDNIKAFDEENITSRQKIILLTSIKNLYDNREKFGNSKEELKVGLSSISLSEHLKWYVDDDV
mgnify:FL=1